MTTESVIFRQLTFAHESMSINLFENIDIHFTYGWTGIIGANGTGKSTLLHLATGLLKPDQGAITVPEDAVYCEQRTDAPPADLQNLIQVSDKPAATVKSLLNVQEDWTERWETLSHGERKRSQIAVALWKNPFVLALDEPTNHVDTKARDSIRNALQQFRGIGLLVSHDRALLDALCTRFLFVNPPGVTMRTGTIDEGLQQEKRALAQLSREYDQTQKQLQDIKAVADGHRREASRAHQKRSKKGISPKDHDAKAKKDLARMSGKDGQSGRLLKQQSGKIRQAQKKLDGITVVKQYDMGVWQEGAVSRRNTVLNIPSQTLSLGNSRTLQIPPLIIRPEDRIGITGENGTGKSTLIQLIAGAVNVPHEKLICMPQEINETQSRTIIQEVRRLPGEQLGHLMSIVNRLGTRPPRLLESDLPSPGEIRKTMLALGIIKIPELIIMDEPTNHLDLPSVECLESMLQECPCALLLVSHDHIFLDRLIQTRWEIQTQQENPQRSLLKIR